MITQTLHELRRRGGGFGLVTACAAGGLDVLVKRNDALTLADIEVPMEYARDGQIVLNIAPRAVGNLELANDEVRFNARFGGIPRQIGIQLQHIVTKKTETHAKVKYTSSYRSSDLNFL